MYPGWMMRSFNRYFQFRRSFQKHINGHLIAGTVAHAAYRKDDPTPETSIGIDQILVKRIPDSKHITLPALAGRIQQLIPHTQMVRILQIKRPVAVGINQSLGLHGLQI